MQYLQMWRNEAGFCYCRYPCENKTQLCIKAGFSAAFLRIFKKAAMLFTDVENFEAGFCYCRYPCENKTQLCIKAGFSAAFLRIFKKADQTSAHTETNFSGNQKR